MSRAESEKYTPGTGVPDGGPLAVDVGKVTSEQVRKIAETKFNDLNAYDLGQAEKIIKGTARSMGIEISDE